MKIDNINLDDLMTVDELFDRVNYMMFGEQDDKEDFEEMFTTFANIIMADCFWINNALRLQNGKKPLTVVPQLVLSGDTPIESTEEETDRFGNIIEVPYLESPTNAWTYVPYEDIVVQNLLVWGITGRIFMDDEEERGAEYTAKYEDNKRLVLGTQWVDIIDAYR